MILTSQNIEDNKDYKKRLKLFRLYSTELKIYLIIDYELINSIFNFFGVTLVQRYSHEKFRNQTRVVYHYLCFCFCRFMSN